MKILKTLIFVASLLSLPAFAGQPVDVNAAEAAQLAEALDGIGMAKAQAIVDYRQQHGAFKHVDELVNVKGIGLRTVERNRENIRLGETPPNPDRN